MAAVPVIRFCSFIVNSNQQRTTLRLSRTFATNLPTTMTRLRVPSGDIWEVHLDLDITGTMWITEGWTAFFDFYSVTNGYMLMFEYKGTSTVDVAIFGTNQDEIAYPIRVNEPGAPP
ncbi:B3 domain-containing transcription factor VRN1 [Linum perenne]